MKEKHRIVITLGVICLTYWGFDFIANALIPHHFSWLLWYSSAGLLLTGIALITENTFLIYSLFCALFIPEMLWMVDFSGRFLFDKSLFGLTTYTHAISFTKADLYLTLYHFLIPISLLYAVFHTAKSYKYGWIGAIFFATTLFILTYFLVSPHDQVNCIQSFSPCKTVFSFLYAIPNPERIFLALISLVVFIYIPTNFLILRIKK